MAEKQHRSTTQLLLERTEREQAGKKIKAAEKTPIQRLMQCHVTIHSISIVHY